ncbi:MAG: FGLLP motif-containing membrane protein [Actinomycetota bacterium]
MLAIAAFHLLTGHALAEAEITEIDPPSGGETHPGSEVSATVTISGAGPTPTLDQWCLDAEPDEGTQVSFDDFECSEGQEQSGFAEVTMRVDVAANAPPGERTIVVRLFDCAPNPPDPCTPDEEADWPFTVIAPSPSPSPSPLLSPSPPAGVVIAEASPSPRAFPSPGVSLSPSPTPSPFFGGTPSPADPDFFPGRIGRPLARDSSDSEASLRSRFVLAVPAPGEVSLEAARVGTNALLALLLVLLLMFPAQLFNSTLEENYEEVKGWFGFAAPAARKAKAGLRKVMRSWMGFGLVTVVTAVLYGLLDPEFGGNPQSLSLLLGVVGAIVIVTAAAELFSSLYIRRSARTKTYLKVFPGALMVAVLCVGVSRLVDFQPGYLYGLVAGVAFRGRLDPRQEGKSAAISALAVLAVSIAAWAAWVPVNRSAQAPGAGFGVIALEALLVAVFVSGLEGLLFGLVPMRFLDGQKLITWNRLVWAVLFWVSLFAFIHILLNPATGFIGLSSTIPLVIVAGLFLSFALFSVGFWAYFRLRPARA